MESSSKSNGTGDGAWHSPEWNAKQYERIRKEVEEIRNRPIPGKKFTDPPFPKLSKKKKKR